MSEERAPYFTKKDHLFCHSGGETMTKGELDYAIRQALNKFDDWNDSTGALAKGTSWYYEAQGCIEDAVRIGARVACEGIDTDLSDISRE